MRQREVHAIVMTMALGLLALDSCEHVPWGPAARPARLVAGRADTVVINSPRSTMLPVRALDSTGNAVRVANIRYSWISGTPITVSDSGKVTCDRRLDAVLRASAGSLETQFTLLCRPVKTFRVALEPMYAPLVVGGKPLSLVVNAIGLDGAPVTELAATTVAEDTSIAVVTGDRVTARRAGMAGVAVDLGVCVLSVGFEVFERVTDPAALRRREQVFLDTPPDLTTDARREWPLPRGEYRLALLPSRDARPELELLTTGMNCVAEAGLHCIALANASVTLRRSRRPTQWAEHGATLKLQRLDVPSSPSVREPAQNLRWVGSENPPCPLPG